MTIRFTAATTPHGKQRARTTMRGGYAHSYTPKETVEFERTVAQACKAACKGVQMPPEAPLSMDLICYMPIPKSVSKRRRELMGSEHVYHTKKPDASNILKSVEDAVIGIAYKDDSQLAWVRARKVYSENPRIEVLISTIGG